MIQTSSDTFELLKNSDIFNVIDCGESDKYEFTYLSFETTKQLISLTPTKCSGNLDAININPEDIYSLDAHNTIVDIAVETIIDKAFKNSKNEKMFILDLEKPKFLSHDKDILDEVQLPNHGRKLIARIFTISNIIAMNSRRGPANYVILPENLYKIIEVSTIKKYKGLYKPNNVADNLYNMTILCSDKLKDDEFVVGRKPNREESGLHVITSEHNLSNYISLGPDEMIQKIGVKILFIDDNDCTVYGCKINWT